MLLRRYTTIFNLTLIINTHPILQSTFVLFSHSSSIILISLQKDERPGQRQTSNPSCSSPQWIYRSKIPKDHHPPVSRSQIGVIRATGGDTRVKNGLQRKEVRAGHISITPLTPVLQPCSKVGRSFGKKTLSAFEDRTRPVNDCGGFAAVAEPRSLGS
ncbi:hypothetical protein KM043_013111 [Ampulex compressa]|nr:hypothetical protein KM043_013111 [Ampulex compressa]